tara:strand:+ start:23 stop:292 length:270 start_codon:yes stop_codon:yes gene_type:complete
MYKTNDKIRIHRELLKQALFNAPNPEKITQTITVEGISVKCDSDGPSGFTHWGRTFMTNEKALQYAKDCLSGKIFGDQYKDYELIIVKK